MLESLTAAAALLGAIGSLVAAIGVFMVNAKVDRFIGRVEALEASHNAHVHAAGLHGR